MAQSADAREAAFPGPEALTAPQHRRDIDGLRAVAVLSVVAFHMQHGWLPGGYLGVDIFFVISGFLITGILWREATTGRASILRFYERRIRRIAPALLAMMALVTVAAAVILLPVDLVGYGRSALSTLAFVSNVYFWRDTNYFSRQALEKPLLHTWSLGIEEQFYILFPLLVFVGARWFRGATPWVIAALTFASLALNILAVRAGAGTPAFYLLPTRAWELGAGAILVFLPRPTSRALAETLALTGAGLMAAGLLLAEPIGRSQFGVYLSPGLLAVAGSALVIGAGGAAPSLVGRLLGTSPAVFVGLISYSLYLWHWPVIVLTRYFTVREPTALEQLGELALMTALAVLSWRYVERPFRERSMPVRRVLAICGAGVVLVAAAAAALIATGGLPARLSPAAAQINAAVGTNYRCPVQDYLAFGASRACRLNLPSGDPRDADLVLLGNSHAQMYAPLVADIARERGRTAMLVPANGCLPTTGFNIDTGCNAIAETNLRAVLALPRARTVVIALTWTQPNRLVDAAGRPAPLQGVPGVVHGVEATITRLQAQGRRVVVVGPIAYPGWDVASDLSRSLAFGRHETRPLFTPEPEFRAQHAAFFDRFAARPDLTIIRPDQVQCRAGRCEDLIAGHSLFADSSHIAISALPLFRPAFEAGLR